MGLAYAVVTEHMNVDRRREWLAEYDDNRAYVGRRAFAATYGG